MLEVFNFIREYWRELLSVVTLILSIVFFILKKKNVKVVDTINEFICALLPVVINQAEAKFGADKGELKRDYVIDIILKCIKDHYSIRYEDCVEYLPFIDKQLEIILSTPQKKGD